MPFDALRQQPAPGPGRHVFLPRRGTMVLDQAAGTVIAVDHGCLWVTLESDLRDVILVRGMHFEIDRTGRTVIAAEDDARFRLVAPASLLDRIVTWLVRKAARTQARWAHRLARQLVPYF
jgi:hypothetical protein